MKFFCDEMLKGLGRWLRIAGYDTLIVEPGTSDSDILKLVKRSNRYFLTCDSVLAQRLADYKKLAILQSSDIEQSVKELNRLFHFDWTSQAFQRCSVCNSKIELSLQKNPDIKFPANTSIYYCPQCDKYYWEGSHVRRMRKRLQHFQNLK